MARTPSLTTSEAEQLLGPRGTLVVTSDNRGLVKKWLTAQSYPALFVGGLSMRELGLAYNQLDGAGLAAITRKLESAREDMPDMDGAGNETPEREQDVVPAPILSPSPAAVPPSPQDQSAVDLLRNLILTGYKPGIDENQVRSIVQDMLAGVAPRVLEIRHDGKPPVRIEGLVHPQFERVLGYLRQGLKVMLVGPAGCGKTYLIRQLATALGVDHTIVGGTAGATEGDLIGRLLPGDGGRFEYTPSEFVRLYEQGNALLAFDEIDGFDPNMLMVANMPLANGHMYVHLRKDNPCVTRGPNVCFIATANTYGTGSNPMYVGRNPMDEATRDRFVFVTVDYDKTLEQSIAAAGSLSAAETASLWEMRDRCREAGLRRVISTRAFEKAAGMKRCGDTWREIRDRLLEGWSKDEKAKVGV